MFNVLDFGASGDAVALNTDAIQQAVDTCAAKGGGTVVIPAGIFRSGTIRLKNHVELHLEQGAVLLASENLDDFNPLDEYPSNSSSQREEWVGKHLIIAYHAEDVSLTGPGTLDGSGEAYFGRPGSAGQRSWPKGMRKAKNKETLRLGQLVVFVESTHIRVTDLNIRHASCWALHCHGCENVQIRGLNVQNGIADGNTDGIDIDCCRHVTVSDCVIDSGDDAIAIRGAVARLPVPKPCENITVSNCVLASSACGFRIGVGSGIIRHVEIGNCVIHRSGTAFLFQSSYSTFDRAGVDISNVHIHHIDAYDTAVAFSIVPGSESAVGRIHDISFDNCRLEMFIPGAVLNSGAVRVREVKFRDCDFTVVAPALSWLNWQRPPEPVNLSALVIQHADQIVFRDCRVLWHTLEKCWKKAIETEDVPGLEITNCKFEENNVK